MESRGREMSEWLMDRWEGGGETQISSKLLCRLIHSIPPLQRLLSFIRCRYEALSVTQKLRRQFCRTFPFLRHLSSFLCLFLAASSCGCTNCPKDIVDLGETIVEIDISTSGASDIGSNKLVKVCFNITHTRLSQVI